MAFCCYLRRGMGGPPSAPNRHLHGVTGVPRHSVGAVPTHHAQAVKKRTHPGIVGNLVHAVGAAQSDTDSMSGRNGIFTDSRTTGTRSGIDCHWKRRRDRHQLHATTSGAMPVRKEGGLPASINCKLSGIVRRRRGWIVVTHCGAAWADRPRPVCPFTQAPKHD